jgi:subtilisin family serine protease
MITKGFQPPKTPMRVSGELLIKLSPSSNAKVSTTIPTGPVRRIITPLPKSFGISAIDEVLKKLKTSGISRVHGRIRGEKKEESKSMKSQIDGLNALYRIRFEDVDIDLDKARSAFKALKEVEDVDFNYYMFPQVTPNDPMFVSQWGLNKIRCPLAWDIETGKTSIVIAVVDTGVDLNHPDLAANIIAGFDSVDLTPYGVSPGDTINMDGVNWVIEGDVLTTDNDPQDEVGHGTHVAGIIAAVTNNSTGVAGVTWRCKIQPVRTMFRIRRVSDGAITGIGTSADIAAGVRWAVDNGANIINMSLGAYNDDMAQRDAVTYATSNDVIVVAAMGNENTNSLSYPAAYPDVIAVGATDSSDNRSWFSNYGPHIDVVAPGQGIRSTCLDDTYAFKDGTSMAAPHVSGLVALILSVNSRLSRARVTEIIKNSAQPLKDDPADPVPNDKYGFGRIDAKSALDSINVMQKSDVKELKEYLPKEIRKETIKEISKESKEFEKSLKEYFKEYYEKDPREYIDPKRIKEYEGKQYEGKQYEGKQYEGKAAEKSQEIPQIPYQEVQQGWANSIEQIEQRLRIIEKMLSKGKAFISPSERPDVEGKIANSDE